MKKIVALILALIFALSLTSCTVVKKDVKDDDSKTAAADSAETNKKDSKKEDKKDNGSNGEKPSAAVDYSKELKKLDGKQKKIVDSLGESKKNEKLVAYFGDDYETQFIVADFKDGKISKVTNYRFIEIESKFNVYEALSHKQGIPYTVYKDERCVEMDETKKYSGKTYDEMLKLLDRYDFK